MRNPDVIGLSTFILENLEFAGLLDASVISYRSGYRPTKCNRKLYCFSRVQPSGIFISQHLGNRLTASSFLVNQAY